MKYVFFKKGYSVLCFPHRTSLYRNMVKALSKVRTTERSEYDKVAFSLYACKLGKITYIHSHIRSYSRAPSTCVYMQDFNALILQNRNLAIKSLFLFGQEKTIWKETQLKKITFNSSFCLISSETSLFWASASRHCMASRRNGPPHFHRSHRERHFQGIKIKRTTRNSPQFV